MNSDAPDDPMEILRTAMRDARGYEDLLRDDWTGCPVRGCEASVAPGPLRCREGHTEQDTAGAVMAELDVEIWACEEGLKIYEDAVAWGEAA